MTIKLVTNEVAYPDLVNNFQLFHEYNSEEDLLSTRDKWGDDSDYTYFRTIEDLFENITLDDYDRTHIVSVDIKDIFSSDDGKSGCDRPVWSITNKSAIKQQHESLNRHETYHQHAAGTLSGMLRPHPTLIDHWQLVKYIGNNRVAMKLLANNGISTRVLMSISFHEVGKKVDNYVSIEAELHSTDAGDRSGQNESQKFISGYRAKRVHEVYTFNFLKKYGFNYGSIMQQEGIEGSENWLSIKSLQGIKNGMGNGHFKTYGEHNVGNALNTVKKLCEITKETVIGATPIECIALMYYVYTEHGKREENSTPIFSPEELDEYFVKFFTYRNDDKGMFKKDNLPINKLSWSGGVKDIPYICAKEFWPTIVEYWMDINDNKIGFSVEAHANRILVSLSKDSHLKKEITKIIA